MNQSFSIYIHIPYCISKCAYCDFYSMGSGSSIPDSYITALSNEIEFRMKEFYESENKKNLTCKSVYIGGGTPSLLSRKQLLQISHILKKNITETENFEFTIEANPDDVTENFLETAKESGVTRLSCGIQSMNDSSLKLMNRRAKSKENEKALDLLKKGWNGVLSLDLIAGLPFETDETFVKGLDKVLSANPQHISLYSLTVEDETPLGKMIASKNLDYDYDAADEMWLLGRNYLIQKGYVQYEVSNFAKPGFECVHNQSYWHHENYLGFGSGATGTLYSGNKGRRTSNTTETADYIKVWLESDEKNTLDYKKIQEIENIMPETNAFEFFMMGLRTSRGISSENYMEIFGNPVPSKIVELFESWQKKNLAEIKVVSGSDVNYSLSSKGLLFLNGFLSSVMDLL